MPYDFAQPAEVWLSRSEQLNACVVEGVALDTDLAAWVGSLPDISHQKLVQVGLVPICPELRAILVEAFERAEPVQTHVVPIAVLLGVNLRTQLERIIPKAGHETWPRLLQNLRTSCATDWVERYPSHVVAKWLGHSPKVAAQHHLMSREHHFEDVVRGAAAGDVAAKDPPQESLPIWDAKCDAISADRVELLARAVILVAGMAIPEVAREVVLERVVSLLGTPAAQKQNHK